MPIGRAVKSAVACVDDADVPDAVVPAGAGSPPPHAVTATDVAAIVRNNRAKDKGLFGAEHAYGALFDGLGGA